MPERWENGLKELSRVPMSEGLLERAEDGVARPDPSGPSTSRRIGIAVFALGVFVVGSLGIWQLSSLRDASRPLADETTPQRVYGETDCPVVDEGSGKTDAIDGSSVNEGTYDPLGECAVFWQKVTDQPAPHLIACVPNDRLGTIAVVAAFTSPDGSCDGVNAQPVPDRWDANLTQWRATEEEASHSFPGEGAPGMTCQTDMQAAIDAWRHALDDNGFTSWRVTVGDPITGFSCFNYKVEYDAMRVEIVYDSES